MRAKRLSAVFLAVLMTIIISFPVFASAAMSGNPQSASTSDGGSGILGLLPDANSLGIPINKNEIADLKYVDVRFPNPYKKAISWQFPYSDDFFSQPNNSYCHLLAQGSLGLAVSAFKSDLVNYKGYSDLKSYFDSIGFGNLNADPFNNTPTANSVTYAIASKKIKDETVIALVCCGAGYGKEWSSNLTVGDSERHQGFDEAARTVENALADYISKYGISGRITLWTSGYSRAAAIANLVAADMTDSGPFQKVYCYSFATPATTKHYKHYPNIFNIVGKNDPVPSIPFADWGYIRNGTNLYLPTVQMDSDFSAKAADVNNILKLLDGNEFIYNPEFCEQWHTVFDYLYSLLPSSAEYSSDLQPGVLQVLANSSGNNILALVSKIVTTFTPDNEQERQDMNALLDYIELLANQYVLKGNRDQIRAGMWNPDFTVTQNLTIEHDPDRYVAWMFLSNDPEEIFGQNINFKELTIKGKVWLHFYDNDGYLCTIDPNGKTSYSPPAEESVRENLYIPSFYTRSGNGQINISIPSDREYLISVESRSDQTITYYASTRSVSTVRSYMSKIYTLDADSDDKFFLYFGTDGLIWSDDINIDAAVTDVWAGSYLYSPGVILSMQNINFLHLTITQIIVFIISLIVFTYSELIVCATLGFVRIVQGYQRRTIPTVTMHCLNAALFLTLEIGLWYFVPAYPTLMLAAKLISFLFIFSLSLVALSEHFSKKNLLICIGLLVFMALSVIFESRLLPNVTLKSVIIKVAFYTMLAIAAALTWVGHTRRRALKIAEVENRRHKKKMAKAEKAVQKAYDKAEKETQKYLAKQKKKNETKKES